MLSYRKKLGYAFGDLGISVSYFAVGFFYMFYLTDIVGLPAYWAGLAVFIGKLWDGINDPLVGIINDRFITTKGRKRTFILWGALPFALSFMLLWFIPVEASQVIKFILATLSLLLYATTYSIVVVPYMALVPVMSDEYDERTQITGLRAILSTVGTIIGGGLAMWISSFENEILGLHSMALGFGLFTALSLWIAAKSVSNLEHEQTINIVPVRLSAYFSLIKDKNVLVLLGLKFLGAIGTGALSASIPYYAEHVMGDRALSSKGLAAYVLASALFIPLWSKATKKFDKRKLLLISNLLSALVLYYLGFHITSGDLSGFYLTCFMLGVVMSAYLLIPYSLVPDLVEYYRLESGEQHESVFFGLWISTHQLGLAVSGLLLGILLGVFGYEGGTTITADSVLAVKVALGVLPGLFLILGGLLVQIYGIDREQFNTIKASLTIQQKVPLPENAERQSFDN